MPTVGFPYQKAVAPVSVVDTGNPDAVVNCVVPSVAPDDGLLVAVTGTPERMVPAPFVASTVRGPRLGVEDAAPETAEVVKARIPVNTANDCWT